MQQERHVYTYALELGLQPPPLEVVGDLPGPDQGVVLADRPGRRGVRQPVTDIGKRTNVCKVPIRMRGGLRLRRHIPNLDHGTLCVRPSVQHQLKHSNISNYSIFLRDGYLFSYLEYTGTDFDADMAAMRADEQTRRWWTFTDPCQEPVETAGPNEWWAPMEELFHLD